MPESIADLDAFRAELVLALAEFQGSQKDLADELDVSPSKITDWKMGRVETPPPAEVFRMERALGCAPGRLSSHLGYLPLDSAGEVETAILADRSLSVENRRVLLHLYKQLASEGHGTAERPDERAQAE